MLQRQAFLRAWPTTLSPGQHLHAPRIISKCVALTHTRTHARARLSFGAFGVIFGGDALVAVKLSSSSSLSLCVSTRTVKSLHRRIGRQRTSDDIITRRRLVGWAAIVTDAISNKINLKYGTVQTTVTQGATAAVDNTHLLITGPSSSSSESSAAVLLVSLAVERLVGWAAIATNLCNTHQTATL